jgi:hypothetical protein
MNKEAVTQEIQHKWTNSNKELLLPDQLTMPPNFPNEAHFIRIFMRDGTSGIAQPLLAEDITTGENCKYPCYFNLINIGIRSPHDILGWSELK